MLKSFRQKRQFNKCVQEIRKKIDVRDDIPRLDSLDFYLDTLTESRAEQELADKKLYCAKSLGAVGLYYVTRKIDIHSNRIIIPEDSSQIEYAKKHFMDAFDISSGKVHSMANGDQEFIEAGDLEELLIIKNREITPIDPKAVLGKIAVHA